MIDWFGWVSEQPSMRCFEGAICNAFNDTKPPLINESPLRDDRLFTGHHHGDIDGGGLGQDQLDVVFDRGS